MTLTLADLEKMSAEDINSLTDQEILTISELDRAEFVAKLFDDRDELSREEVYRLDRAIFNFLERHCNFVGRNCKNCCMNDGRCEEGDYEEPQVTNIYLMRNGLY